MMMIDGKKDGLSDAILSDEEDIGEFEDASAGSVETPIVMDTSADDGDDNDKNTAADDDYVATPNDAMLEDDDDEIHTTTGADATTTSDVVVVFGKMTREQQVNKLLAPMYAAITKEIAVTLDYAPYVMDGLIGPKLSDIEKGVIKEHITSYVTKNQEKMMG